MADLLARRFERGVHVKGDVFRRMVVSGRVEMHPDAPPEAEHQLELRYRLAAATADAFFDAGFTVVVQDIVLGDHLDRYVHDIRSRPLHVVVLAPRLDVVAVREGRRAKTAYRSGDYAVAQLDDALRTRTARIGLWLDNSDQTPDQTVGEILARIDEARI